MIRALVERETWVIEGVSSDVQSQADAIVFLDVPRWVSFVRVTKRNWRYLFRSRPDLPPGCPELLIVPTLCRIIWRFPKDIRPRILNPCTDSQRFFHVRGPADLAACLEALDACSSQEGLVTGASSSHRS